ncbi:hypothetical protein [Streptosporangium sandarakinum]|uniref:hypothetical protein n=1 Tax=Streptosporangium sandarakinum TaxID=1260955 RepID=UPI0037BB12BF
MTGRRLVRVSSAGRTLTVDAPSAFISAWPGVAPHVPGASPGPLDDAGGRAAAVLPDDAADARRVINAHLHVLHLATGTLSVHATCLHRPEVGAVLLLGGHGVGKTLTGAVLAELGWDWLAGDVTLVDAVADGGPAVRGGTSALLGRRAGLRRWFPAWNVAADGAAIVALPGHTVRQPVGPVRVAAAVFVDVDGDPAERAVLEGLDRHTAATAWLRASGHLLDRLLAETGARPLRALEDERAQRRRVRYVRSLADAVPVYAGRGTPQGIAARICDVVTAEVRSRCL